MDALPHEHSNLEVDTLTDWKPVELSKDRSDVFSTGRDVKGQHHMRPKLDLEAWWRHHSQTFVPNRFSSSNCKNHQVLNFFIHFV